MRKKLSWSAILAAIAAAVALSRGGHHGPPSPPDDPPPVPTYTLNVHICDGTPCVEGDEHHKVPGATVAYADDKPAGVTDGSGNVDFPGVPAGGYHVCAKADGYTETCVDAALPAGGSVFLVLAPNVPPVLALRIDGKVFRDSTGAIWPYRGVTAFTLLERVAKGEDIGPYLDKRRAAGANLVRVLSTMKFITNLPPESYSDSQLAALFATAHAHGVRVEIVALADATDWPLAKQRAHVQRIVDAVAAAGALDLVEVSNEAFKNSAPPRDIMPGVTRRAGVLMASGGDGPTCDNLSPFVLDYVTYHPERKDEWPRTAKDELELRDGFGCKDANGNDAPGTAARTSQSSPTSRWAPMKSTSRGSGRRGPRTSSGSARPRNCSELAGRSTAPPASRRRNRDRCRPLPRKPSSLGCPPFRSMRSYASTAAAGRTTANGGTRSGTTTGRRTTTPPARCGPSACWPAAEPTAW
jgi:hypothetical protein